MHIQVSASFAASLVTSPAIGAYLGRAYSDNLVIALASFVAILDVGFLLLAVPESLPEKCRPATWGSHIAWEKADPFAVSFFRDSFWHQQFSYYNKCAFSNHR